MIVPYQVIYEQTGQLLPPGIQGEAALKVGYGPLEGREWVMNLGGISINYRDWQLGAPLILETRHERPFLKMQFELEGHSQYTPRWQRGSKATTIEGGTHILMFHPAVYGKLFYPKSRRVLDIEFTVDYFKKLFQDDFSAMGAFGTAILDERPELIDDRSLPVTGRMKSIIQEILDCPFENHLKKLYVESKAIELLLLQLDQFSKCTQTKETFKLRNDDRDRLHQLKEMIEQNPNAQHSLKELAQLVGINEFKLKKGFKTLFGHTVFGYINQVRLEQAKQLLGDPRLNINEISYLTGYKYPQHFTNAFKKQYGYLPKDWRAIHADCHPL